MTLLLALTSLLAFMSTVLAAQNQIVQVTDFGTNPRNTLMYIYVPTKLAANPPILVSVHWCTGTAQAAFTGSQYATWADTYGYIVIYPQTPASSTDRCWDVSSTQTLSHNGGGDSQGIVSMVNYALKKYKGNAKRVFVTGTSSGAMMTNVLLGAYPDVFAGGAAFAGVPFGCFAGNGYDVWNAACANGQVIKTGTEWANIVKAAYPSYTGWRPKFQTFHGTADTTLYYQNFLEQIKMWTSVLGLPASPISTTQNTPLSGWTKTVYGEGRFEAYSAQGVSHNIPTQDTVVLKWFDLACVTGSCFSRP